MTHPSPKDDGGQTGSQRRWLRILGVLLAGLALLWLVWISFFDSTNILTEPGPTIAGRELWVFVEETFLNDFGAYLNAAIRLAGGGSLYLDATVSAPYHPGPFGLYMYAPPFGVSFLPFAAMDHMLGASLWLALHVLALVAACALMPVRPLIRLFGFVVGAFGFMTIQDIALGNVSVLLLLPMVMAWRWLDRPLGSMAQALAISIRPTLGIVILWQLLRRRWRAVAWTVGTGLALIILTLPAVGIGAYLDYLAVLRNMTGISGVSENRDLGSAVLDLGGSDALAVAALVAGYSIAIGAILVSLRRDREVGFMVTLSASLLLSPLLWDHYLALLLLPAAFVAERGRPWALLLPVVTWLPVVTGAWALLYPAILMGAVLLPFLARPALPGAAEPISARSRLRATPGVVR